MFGDTLPIMQSRSKFDKKQIVHTILMNAKL